MPGQSHHPGPLRSRPRPRRGDSFRPRTPANQPPLTMTLGSTDDKLAEGSESEFRNKVDSEGEKLAVEQAEGAAKSLKGANEKLEEGLNRVKALDDAAHGRYSTP